MPDEIPEPLLARLSEFVAARMGLHFPPEHWGDLARNLRPACAQFGFTGAEEGINWLLAAELTRREIETLASHLTVGETYFFREKQIFDVLEERVVPDLIRARGVERRLRIWSAGCCSGEEPYSIAIWLSRVIPDWKAWNITILATDINPHFLRKAAAGVYGEWSFRDTPAWVKESHFKKRNHSRYEILPPFKNMVEFAYLNLADDVYPTLANNTNAMDLIFCRNVLMYFSPAQARKVIGHFHSALVDGGWLIVSATETSPMLYRPFAAVNLEGYTFYKKAPKAKRERSSGVVEPWRAGKHTPPDSPPLPSPLPVRRGEGARRAGEEVPALYEEALALYEAGQYAEAAEKLLALMPARQSCSAGVSPASSAGVSLEVPDGETPPEPAAEDGGATANAAALLARIRANEGQLREALDWCDQAIAAHKINPELHYLRATILQEQGRLERAAAALKRALYLAPDFALAHFALGNLAARRENFDAAHKHFENALSLLNRHSPAELLPGSDGLTAGRLREIIRATLLQEEMS